jgi:anaerobic selenocysteine-containing dehydrogenase
MSSSDIPPTHEPGRARAPRVVHKVCNLCEAMCGLLIEVEDGRVERIRPDPNDPLSQGAMCAKAMGLKEIQEDPDRLRTPVRRTSEGWEPISWEEAFEEASERIAQIQREHGNDAVGSYLGNPGAHNFSTVIYLAMVGSALDTHNRYVASSLDQNPKHASSLLLYGNILSIPVPDVDHTDFLLVIGANPIVSNGSLMSAPGFLRRARELQARGGRIVVIDPRRSETAEIADAHLPIRPGTDALLLAALVQVVLEEGIGRQSALERWIDGLDTLRDALAPFSAEAVESDVGIAASEIRALARDFAAAPSAACYSRVGTCMNPYGTLASWLVDVFNLVTGNLDRAGGILLPKPAADLAELLELRGSAGTFSEWRTRVRGAPSFNDEAPTVCLAEEILEPGPGQVRGMLSIAGNPCLSAPNGRALERAFASLEYYVAVDFYINETTRHANLILPPTWSLEHDNHEILFHGFAVHNTARYSPVVIPPRDDQRDDWQILSRLALDVMAKKQTSRVKALGYRLLRRAVPGPRRVLDWLLRIGHYGDGFLPWRRGLRLRDLEATPSGIDLGRLAPRLGEILEQRGRRIDLAHPRILAELGRLEREGCATLGSEDSLQLIGRRDPRTNNSWFHNIPLGVAGRERCTLQMHPHDAKARRLEMGDAVLVRSRVGELIAPLELTDALMEGVVSLPHGWGHRGEGMRMKLASEHAGVNCNDLVDDAVTEGVVANAVFNGVPVRVTLAE